MSTPQQEHWLWDLLGALVLVAVVLLLVYVGCK